MSVASCELLGEKNWAFGFRKTFRIQCNPGIASQGVLLGQLLPTSELFSGQ